MKIKEIISNGLDLNKCYPSHDLEQYLRGYRLNILGNANVSGALICKLITRKVLNENNYSVLGSSRNDLECAIKSKEFHLRN